MIMIIIYHDQVPDRPEQGVGGVHEQRGVRLLPRWLRSRRGPATISSPKMKNHYLTWLSSLIAGFSDGRRLHQHWVQDAGGDHHATIWSLIFLGHQSGHGHPHRHQQPHRQRYRGKGGEQHSRALLTPSSTIFPTMTAITMFNWCSKGEKW